MKEEPHEQGRRIREIEATDERLKGRKISAGSVADPAIWNKSTGVYDALRSSLPFRDKNRIEIVE